MSNSRKKTVLERVEAFEKLIDKDESNIQSILRKALLDSSPTVRSFVVKMIAEKGITEMLPDLMHLLNDSNSEVRMRTVEAIGVLSADKNIALTLANHLQDKDELVRIAVIEVLGEIGNEKILNDLKTSLSDFSPLVRSYTAEAIGKINPEGSIKLLEEHLQKENDDSAKVGFYGALYSLGRKEYLIELLDLLKGDNYLIRCSVANILPDVSLSESDKRQALLFLKDTLKRETTVAVKSSIKNSVKSLSTS